MNTGDFTPGGGLGTQQLSESLLQKNTVIELIDRLNDMGFSILLIDSTFYVPVEYVPAGRDVDKLTVTGRNITNLIMKYKGISHFGDQQVTSITQEINGMRARTRAFHKDVVWKSYSRI